MLTPDTLWLAHDPVDMRAGIATLALKAGALLHRAPHGGAAFVFTNRARNRIKVLTGDSNGVWFCTRRLNRSHFTWPRDGEDAGCLTPEQFAWLTACVDGQRLTHCPVRHGQNKNILPPGYATIRA